MTQPNPTDAKPLSTLSAPMPALETLPAEKNVPLSAAGSAEIDSDKSKDTPDLSPTFWEDLRDSLPPWLDEFLGLTLILFGILSFVALLFPSGAAVSVAWSQILVQLFGYGSILVAGGIFAMGALLLLPHFGISPHLPPERLLALEIAFLSILAILHLTGTDGELRALARTGGGGGMIGWGLTALPYWLFGRGIALALAVLMLIISIAAMAGVSRAHVIGWLNRTGQKLQANGLRLVGKTPVQVTPSTPADPLAMLLNAQRIPLMRVRPDFDKLPPSLRPGAAPVSTTPKSQADEELAKHPLFTSTGERNLKLDMNLVGELTEKRDTSGYRLVRRPDGREKRFFDTGQMQEIKKVTKREKLLPDLNALADISLNAPDEEEINRTVVLIENTLLEFDIDIDIVDVQIGPTVTRYAIQPYTTAAVSDGAVDRTRLSKIASYSSDIALALSARRLRLELPVPGTNYMGLEVPNKNPSIVALRSVMESKAFADLQAKSGSPLLIPLGRDVSGTPVFMDIAKQPHLLIAGTTGSGKSVCIAAMAAALLLNNTPDLVKMIMLDPKMVELSRFNGLPHLLGPVETDTERIIGVLKWCTREMDRRYKLLEEHAVRNLDNYNAKFGARRRGRDYMPHIVIMIDEIGDLMMSRPEETETTITRLAQMARAVGMHLVVATQRPSVDVITGLIKANFPGRIAFSVASGVDSRVILDSVGAETLLGHGDMLYLAPDAMGPRRVQGCYISDEEVRGIVKHWLDWQKAEEAANRSEELRTSPWERGLTRREFLAETDPMLEDAIEFVVETQEASASLLQRRLGLGYPRAARMIDMLAELGVVGEPVGGGRARRVLIPRGEDPFKRIIDRRMAEQQKKNTSE